MELAAFGPDAKVAGGNGATARGGRVAIGGFLAQNSSLFEKVGPTAGNCADLGDQVPSEFEWPIHGLDFGVREWVLDLPQKAADRLLSEWIKDRGQHRLRAFEGRAAAGQDFGLVVRLGQKGVVRGNPFGVGALLLDGQGRRVQVSDLQSGGNEWLPAVVPGVVRTEQLRRDGRGLEPGTFDPRLLRTGFRVVGEQAFVDEVRGR